MVLFIKDKAWKHKLKVSVKVFEPFTPVALFLRSLKPSQN
ncbi:hypothetical protein SDC9_17771 [bioreactor metagenome]|uniref:Uncharacterized protein n=1 Tax=bioreactor metagenome TaxID=1076179 RepID=A0A644U0M7_9ZZZZ